MIKFFLTILGLISASGAMAQLMNASKSISGEPLKIEKYDRIEGSPYFLNENWQIGTLYSGEKKYENIPLRYNAYENEIEIKRNNQVLVLYKETISGFEFLQLNPLGNELYAFRNGFSSKHVNNQHFFRILYESDSFKIVQDVKMILIKITPAAYGEKEYEKFIPNNQYYIYYKDEMIPEKINLKTLQQYFPEKKEGLKQFIKKKKLDIGNHQHLKLIGDYLVR